MHFIRHSWTYHLIINIKILLISKIKMKKTWKWYTICMILEIGRDSYNHSFIQQIFIWSIYVSCTVLYECCLHGSFTFYWWGSIFFGLILEDVIKVLWVHILQLWAMNHNGCGIPERKEFQKFSSECWKFTRGPGAL